jgi:hypothetical protein
VAVANWPAKAEEEIRAALTKALGLISSTFVRGYRKSMPCRLAEVIAHKRNPHAILTHCGQKLYTV